MRTLLFAVQVTLLVTAQAAEVKPRNRVLPRTNETYSQDVWSKILKGLEPSIDNPNAPPINQPAGSGKVDRIVNGQIMGGVDAVEGQFPWQVWLFVDNAWSCGGSLIMNNWVLTAAHCVAETSGKTHQVTIGTINRSTLSPGGFRLTSTVYYAHPQYDAAKISNDIALIKLPESVTVTANIKTVALPPASDASKTFEGTLATVSGFGVKDDGQVSTTLKFVQVPVITNAVCAAFYGAGTILGSNICTEHPENLKSTCSGDSGGPLVYQDASNTWVQIGVVSFGAASGCLDGPSGFARVTSFLGWISDTINGVASTSSSATTKTTTSKPTKATKPTKPPKCSSFNFAATPTKCCSDPAPAIVVLDKTDKTTYKACKGNVKSINTYYLNKQQNYNSQNNIIFDENTKKALAKDATYVNCYMNATGAMHKNGTLIKSEFMEIMLKNQVADSYNYALIESSAEFCFDTFSDKIANFPVGKNAVVNGSALIIVQCVHLNIIYGCESKLTSSSCTKDYNNFNYCANFFLVNTEEMKAKIQEKMAQKKAQRAAQAKVSGNRRRVIS